MAGLSSIARSYVVYFIISLHIIILQGVGSVERADSRRTSGYVVETGAGHIRGIQGEDYDMFLGIPYAKVDPHHPFSPALEYPKFEKTFEANDDKDVVCPQMSSEGEAIGSLDCLTLNIYIPKSSSEDLLPVLVWIHGGEFETGSASRDTYGPQFLMRHDLILVTFNYRVGIFGFMCFNKHIPGNQGLKDQLMAFDWIVENIKAFGGDPNQMTLGGDGSGAVSVDLHIRSRHAGSFSKFILQGGTILSPGYNKDALTATKAIHLHKVAVALGWTYDDNLHDGTTTALSFMSKRKAHEILRAAHKVGFKSGICIEKVYDDDEEPFLKDDPTSESWLSNGTSNPMIIGCNDDEGFNKYADVNMDNWTSVIDNAVGDIMFPLSKGSMIDMIRNFYIGDKDINNDVKRELINFLSDYNIRHPLERSIRYYLKSGATVFRYMFSYTGERNYMKNLLQLTYGGAASADELGYLFDMKMFEATPNSQDQLMLDYITALWANFVTHGNPTDPLMYKGSEVLMEVRWPELTPDEAPYLALGEGERAQVAVKDRPFKKRMTFWDLFYDYLIQVKAS